jgi:Ca2+-dependent lipid-binding protein
MINGTLFVTLVRGELLRDTELFGDMDPYIEVSLGMTTKKSSICNGGGKNPNFHDQTIQFNVHNNNCEVYYKVLDKENFSSDDDVVGCGK